MRLPFAVPLFLLAYVGLASAQGQAEFAELAAANGGVIKLTTPLFDALTAPNREWSASIQLTALSPQFRCGPCHEFNPSFRSVAKSWSKVNPKDRNHHFFGTLDFAEGQDVFKRLGLNSAPFLNFYPATAGPNQAPSGKRTEWSYDFNAHGFGAQSFAEDLSRHTPVPIPYSPPINYQFYFSVFASLFSIFLTAHFAWTHFSFVFLNRWTWAAVTVLLILVLTGGYMFVQIRGMPYTQVGARGASAGLFAGGFQNQYGIETNLVAALYGLLAACYMALTVFVPRITSPARQRASVYIWSGVLFIFFSILLSVFRVKNGGYPFRLLL